MPIDDEGIDEPGHTDQLRYLRREDQNRESVDEPDHHTARDEAHQLGDTGDAEQDLHRASQQHGGHQVVEAVLLHDGGDDQRDRAGGGGDHRLAARRRSAVVIAIVTDANSPTRGSTPARIENEIASGISASPTTNPARTSTRSRLDERSAPSTVSSGASVGSRRAISRAIIRVQAVAAVQEVAGTSRSLSTSAAVNACDPSRLRWLTSANCRSWSSAISFPSKKPVPVRAATWLIASR